MILWDLGFVLFKIRVGLRTFEASHHASAIIASGYVWLFHTSYDTLANN